MSFVTITLCVASERVFVAYLVMTQSGNFWIHLRTEPEYVESHFPTAYTRLERGVWE